MQLSLPYQRKGSGERVTLIATSMKRNPGPLSRAHTLHATFRDSDGRLHDLPIARFNNQYEPIIEAERD